MSIEVKFRIMKNILFGISLIILTSCGEWSDEKDFRNYLRDKHPYSEITEVNLHGVYSYTVNDTIKDELWVYTTLRDESSLKRVLITLKQ
jgi:hypothetical protein